MLRPNSTSANRPKEPGAYGLLRISPPPPKGKPEVIAKCICQTFDAARPPTIRESAGGHGIAIRLDLDLKKNLDATTRPFYFFCVMNTRTDNAIIPSNPNAISAGDAFVQIADHRTHRTAFCQTRSAVEMW